MPKIVKKPSRSHSSPAKNSTLAELNRLKAWKKRMQVLLKFGIKIATETKLDSLLELIAEETRLILEANRCTVYLHDRKTDELWSKVAHGIGSGKIRFPVNKGLAGEVFMTRQTLNIPNAYQDNRFNPSFDKKTGYKTKTILAMPMLDSQNKEMLGVFQVLNKSKGRLFDKTDEDLLTILAGHAAVAIENAQLYENLRNAQIETVFRLALAAEYRDQEDTAAHLKRMSTYTALIAEGLGYSPDYVETLRLAAPMHDVGKVATPDSILLKPGKLTEGEMARIEHRLFYWIEKLKLSCNSQKMQEVRDFLDDIRQANNPSSTQMSQEIVDRLLHIAAQKYIDIDDQEKPILKDDELKKLSIRRGNLTIEERLEIEKHTLYGSKILANADTPLLKMSETIALCHHEKFDGSGYPRELKGEEIPIEGRIVALADVFDAITSRRVYKRGWNLDEALNFVRREKGKHFDPNVVDSFFRVLPKITEIMNQKKKVSPQANDQPTKDSSST